jgi:hypothetical protein
MGTTTKSITGLFAIVCGRDYCGRITREQFVAGHGTRSVAAQGYLSLSVSCLSGLACNSRRGNPALGDSWSKPARDQARWLLKRLGGLLAQALPMMSGLLPHKSAGLSPAWCPARSVPQAIDPRAVGRQETGVERFLG